MNKDAQPQRSAEEVELQGLPHGLVRTLSGWGILMILVGIVCALYASWEQVPLWGRVVLVLVLPVSLLVYHYFVVRKKKARAVFSLPFGVLLLSSLILPFLCGMFAAQQLPQVTVACVLLYSFALVWYGAYYGNGLALSTAGSLFFAALLSVPLYSGLGIVASAVFFLLLGVALLWLCRWLHTIRHKRMAQQQARRKQQTTVVRKA